MDGKLFNSAGEIYLPEKKLQVITP